ncbi:MAG: ABC transporter substrate-binding protein [Rhizobiaceae bacterium]|nr:ABC transporter substrate-binding protein [Rhizobiaceae bacterium]
MKPEILGAAKIAGALLGAGILAMGTALQPAFAQDTITYGVVSDQSGPGVPNQLPYLRGIQTQFNKVNDAGGINGRKIVLLAEDDKFQVPLGIAAYKKLASNDDVIGISGLTLSGTQVAALPLVAKDKIPVVGPDGTTDASLEPFQEYMFMLVPSYPVQAQVILGAMKDRVGKDKPKVADISVNVESGLGWQKLISETAEAAGTEYVGGVLMDATATSADAIVLKIQQMEPDFIAAHTTGGQANLILKSMEKFGLNIPVMATYASGTPSAYAGLSPEIGAQWQFVHGITPPSVPTDGGKQMLADAEKYGFGKDAASSDFVVGYVAGQLVVQALTDAGENPTRETYHQALVALKDVDTNGLSPSVSFGESRMGINLARPYGYDYATQAFTAVGEWDAYRQYVK